MKNPSPIFPPHLFPLLLLLISLSHPVTSAPPPPATTTFILTSCKTTTYPSLCVKTLTPYAASVRSSPLRLCSAALTAAIRATSNCSAAVSRLASQRGIGRPAALAVKDCIGDLKDAAYELKQTVAAMGHMGGGDREFEWSNAKTYASAAITDAESCVDGFLGRRKVVEEGVRRRIKGCVDGVEKLMSNALALINHLY